MCEHRAIKTIKLHFTLVWMNLLSIAWIVGKWKTMLPLFVELQL